MSGAGFPVGEGHPPVSLSAPDIRFLPNLVLILSCLRTSAHSSSFLPTQHFPERENAANPSVIDKIVFIDLINFCD